MVNKKFSEFTSTNTLQDNEFLPTELLGVENRKITFSAFARQLQDRFLKLSYSDVGVIKGSIISPENNRQSNLIYCDGTTYYADDTSNPLIAKFINRVYDIVELRELLQIPADKSSFKAPDLRNLHLVGAGSGNTALSTISSKSINFISGATTNLNVKLEGSGNFRITASGTNNGAYLHNIVTSGDQNSIIYGETRPSGNTGSFITYNNIGTTDNQYHKVGFNFSRIKTDTSTATTSINVNQSLVDNVNRVPALAIFWYLDIAVDRFTLDPNADTGIVTIDIDQVVGLQDALDSKINITALDGYATITALNTGLDGKANINHSHTIANITDLQSSLDSKANLLHNHLIADLKFDANTSLENWLSTTYSPIAHTHTIASVTGLQTALDNKANVIHSHSIAEVQELQNVLTSKANRVHTHAIADVTGLQGALDSKANVVDISSPALVSIPILATTIVNGAIDNLNLGTPVLLFGNGVVGDYVSVAGNIIKTNTNKKIISFSSSILANYSQQNNSRSYRLLVRRPAVVSVVGTNANDILNEGTDAKLNTGSIADSEFTFAKTYTNGATDPFNVDGFVLSIDNISGLDISTITTRVGYAKASYIRIEFK